MKIKVLFVLICTLFIFSSCSFNFDQEYKRFELQEECLLDKTLDYESDLISDIPLYYRKADVKLIDDSVGNTRYITHNSNVGDDFYVIAESYDIDAEESRGEYKSSTVLVNENLGHVVPINQSIIEELDNGRVYVEIDPYFFEEVVLETISYTYFEDYYEGLYNILEEHDVASVFEKDEFKCNRQNGLYILPSPMYSDYVRISTSMNFSMVESPDIIEVSSDDEELKTRALEMSYDETEAIINRAVESNDLSVKNNPELMNLFDVDYRINYKNQDDAHITIAVEKGEYLSPSVRYLDIFETRYNNEHDLKYDSEFEDKLIEELYNIVDRKANDYPGLNYEIFLRIVMYEDGYQINDTYIEVSRNGFWD